MFWLGVALFSTQVNAQLQKGQLVDGIAAVIGNEIILESDIVEQANFAKQQGLTSLPIVVILWKPLNNKLLIYHAKRHSHS